MNSSPTRVRFAPSPTGFLHIGGVRTALFNYLYAKQNSGSFLLRIEDTDVERSEDRFTQDILSSLSWLGIQAAEPLLFQSQRLKLYHSIAEDLIQKGFAYKCYATEEEVEAGRQRLIEAGKKPMYDRTWRDRSDTPSDRKEYVIRAKFPLTGEIKFTDLIRGEITFPAEDIDDFVLIRSNGVPTYNVVVVGDDLEMKISHVIRGDDHINNTPKQVFLYQALGAIQPLFAHLPMILGPDKKKLSKRNGEVSTNYYRQEGYLPESILNFLARLGWSHGDQEIFTLDELIEFFSLEKVQLAGAVFNPEKLLWTQAEHLKRADSTRLAKILIEDFQVSTDVLTPYGVALIDQLKLKLKLLKEFKVQLEPLLSHAAVSVDSSALKWNKDSALKEKIKLAVTDLVSWLESKNLTLSHTAVDQELRMLCEKHQIKLGDLTQPLRLFVTGSLQSSIGLFDLIPIMPSSVLILRLKECLTA